MGNKQGKPKDGKTATAQGPTKAAPRSSQTSSAPAQEAATSAHDEDHDIEVIPEVEEPEKITKISFLAELGGGKGWPADSTVVCYHNATGLVVTGTETGALFAYGDGFQYLQPAIESMDITHILSLNDDSILVGFADNSMAVLMLPSLNLSHKLSTSWLNDACGDVTCVHVDEKHQRPYAYIGTSEGYVRVLQVLPEFREVEYCITAADAGVGSKMAVSSIEVSPKDERYLLISYDSHDEKTGAVIVFDMVKHKTFRIYKTKGITTAAFDHTGEALYAGTRSGEVLSLGIDKASTSIVWSSKSELINEDDDDDIPVIRKMQWMFPQAPGAEGCLFVLLGSLGLDTDNMKSVIVALLPSSQGDMRSIFSAPPLPNVEVRGFRIVSTCEKNTAGLEAPVPGLLLLGQSDGGEAREFKRELLVMRCPTSPVSEWEMEIGMLPDPRVATEVLPGKTNVSCMAGCIAGSPLAMACMALEASSQTAQTAGALPSADKDDEDVDEDEAADDIVPLAKRTSSNAVRRVSMRDFYNDVSLSQINFQALSDNASTWEMVLANGEREEVDTMDVLFVGHEDGSIIIWGVSLPQQRVGDNATGNCWIPLTALRCGTTEITHISHCNTWLVVADERGTVVVWDCESVQNGMAEEKFRSVLNDSVSFACMDKTGMAFFVGTKAGTVHCAADWNSGSLKTITGIENTPARGEVSYIFMAPYWRDTEYQPAAYVVFSSGHVVVIHVFTTEILAYSECFYDDDELEDYEEAQAEKVVYGCVLNNKYQRVDDVPSPEAGGDTPSKIDPQQSNDSLGTTDSAISASTAGSKAPPASSNFMKKFKRNSSDANSLPPSPPLPPGAPKYVTLVQGVNVRRCDVTKFARVYPSVSSHPISGGVISRPIAAARIVCADVVSYIEDATRFWTQPISSLACIDDTVDMYMVSLQSGSSISRFDALPQVIAEPYDITCAVILPNGNSFICSSNNMIFTSTPWSSLFLQPLTVPTRATTMFSPPDVSMRLSHAEPEVAGGKKAKRRGSFLMSSPVDLDKLFLKTYEQRQKDELFRRTEDSGKARSGSSDISRENVIEATSSTQRTKATLDETRQNFEERGERLSKLNQKMEDFGIAAKEYKANSAAHKEKMRKKAQKWGVF